MTRRTNLLLPDDLVREVDRVAGPRNRSRFVAEAVRDRLRHERVRAAWAASFGAIHRDEHPEWATPDRVVAWVRGLRAEETGEGVDTGAGTAPIEPGAGTGAVGEPGETTARGGRGAPAR